MRAVLLVALGALVLAPAALAKSKAEARILTPIPRDATPGSTIDVEWTLLTAEGRGFNALGVFVELVGAGGGEPTRGYAEYGAHPDGRYSATVVVPDGAIGGVKVGLDGTACYAGGECRYAPAYFPVAGDPLAGPAASAAPTPDASPVPWIGASLVALMGLAWLGRNRVRRSPVVGAWRSRSRSSVTRPS